ncbi:MAG: branched-chain amino acid ABC transporter permease [Thermodesulfobacteriota bacterium]
MTFFSQVVQYTISGLTGGSIYAVIGICWSVVYLIARVLNFTTGEFVMLGGMLTWGFYRVGLGLASAALLAVATSIVIGMMLERITIRPLKFATEMVYMMVTIASASVIKGIILLIWGSETRTFDSFIGTKVIQIFGASLTPQIICVIFLLIVITIGLSLFFNFTLFGKALRACAINLRGARLVGIDVSKFRLFCFGLAGGLGAITGIFITPITFTGYNIGLLAGLKGLVGAIIGGWNMVGTVLAAIALGLLEGFGTGFISSGLKDIFALFVMIIFLILRTLHFPYHSKIGKT